MNLTPDELLSEFRNGIPPLSVLWYTFFELDNPFIAKKNNSMETILAELYPRKDLISAETRFILKFINKHLKQFIAQNIETSFEDGYTTTWTFYNSFIQFHCWGTVTKLIDFEKVTISIHHSDFTSRLIMEFEDVVPSITYFTEDGKLRYSRKLNSSWSGRYDVEYESLTSENLIEKFLEMEEKTNELTNFFKEIWKDFSPEEN